MVPKPLNVLIIEDNKDFAKVLQGALTARGEEQFWAETVGSMTEALVRLSRGDIHACVLDLWLPDSEGVSTVVSIRELSQDLAIVVLTGKDSDLLQYECLGAGADRFVAKPVQIDDLIEKLHHSVIGRAVFWEMVEVHQAKEKLKETDALVERLVNGKEKPV